MFNIGIIGCGKIAQVRHIPEYAAHPAARLAGYYDLNQERAQALQRALRENLQPDPRRECKPVPDTVYLMSGIIDTREEDVLRAIEPHFTVIDRKTEKGWVALAAKRKETAALS